MSIVCVPAALATSGLYAGHPCGGASDAQNCGGQASPILVPVERLLDGTGVFRVVRDGSQHALHPWPAHVRLTMIKVES
jgi:hypothetical protein